MRKSASYVEVKKIQQDSLFFFAFINSRKISTLSFRPFLNTLTASSVPRFFEKHGKRDRTENKDKYIYT